MQQKARGLPGVRHTGTGTVMHTVMQRGGDDTAPVEGVLQTVLNCGRPRRGWRPQSRVHLGLPGPGQGPLALCALDAERVVLVGLPTLHAPGFFLCIIGTPKHFWFLPDHAFRVREGRAWQILAPPGY